MGAEQQRGNSRRRAGGRPFPKGVSGNPGGRPKGSVSLPTALRKELPDKEFAKVLAQKAREGEPWACQIVADRYWPKTEKRESEVTLRDYEGPRREPFSDTTEIESSVPEALSEHFH